MNENNLQPKQPNNPVAFLENKHSLLPDTVFSRFTSHFSRKRIAFTLAEVLITLGIIGVVAALTLPTIIQHKTEKATVVKLQKFSSTFENAFNMAIAEHGPVSQWFEGDIRQAGSCHEVWDKVVPYMPPIIKDCTGKRESGCFSKMLYSLDGIESVNTSEWANYCKAIFSDGIAVSMMQTPWRYGFFKDLGTAYGNIYIDLNGAEAPNTYDKDIFRFTLVEKGVIPAGDAVWGKYDGVWPESLTTMSFPGGRSAWVVYNGNMDYLYCPDELSWNGAHSCKEAKGNK